MNLPLSVVLPAAAASLAYLNAKHSISYDLHFLSCIFGAVAYTKKLQNADRLNGFYMLEEKAQDKKIANTLALIYEGREWTYREFYDEVLRHGQWLKRTYGVSAGHVVAMDFPNSPTFLFIWFGLWSVGAKPAFINYNLTGAPLVHCVKTATARLLLVDEEIEPAFTKDVRAQLALASVNVVYFTKDIQQEVYITPGLRDPDVSRGNQDEASMALLIFTSGTTGMPKAAIFPWRRIYAVCTFMARWIHLVPSDRFYTAMPLYHSSAAAGFMGTMFSNATCVLERKFSTVTFWQTVRSSKATIIQYVGEMCRYLLAAKPSPLDKSHNVRLAFGNGLRADVWDRFKERFGIDTVAEFYAATEGPGGTFNLSSNKFASGAIGRFGSLSRLLFRGRSALVRVDMDTDMPWRDPKTGFCEEVSQYTPGEIILKLDKKDIKAEFLGYYGNETASNKKVLFDVFQKGDAYYRSGDILRRDSEGRTFFQDRIGDTFRWKAENVSTTEVSEVLGNVQGIDEANVYGVEIPGHDGRAGCAAIYLSGNNATPDAKLLQEVAAHASANLPKFAVPIFLRFARELQSTGTLKQQKVGLRNESVDPEKVAQSGDSLYWMRGNTYVPFQKRDWQILQAGQVKL